MANLVAAREALDRFTAELPAAGLAPDRLRRTSEATRALIEQVLGVEGASTAWVDHNLAVLVADGLAHEPVRPAASTLFRGVRRRLGSALESDPDDLAAALALARGGAEALDDPRTADDLRLVVSALARPQAGPALVGAAVRLLLEAAGADTEGVQQAASAAVADVTAAVDRLVGRLPAHPDAALDRARLELLAARSAEGEVREASLDRARARLGDHVGRFGPSRAARSLLAELLELRARSAAAPSDIRRDALELVEAQVADHTLDAAQADRLIRAIERANALDEQTAGHLSSLLEPMSSEDPARWRRPMARLLRRAGDETALLNLWERTLLEDPRHEEAASGLAERLVRNLRAGLASPFESAVLERVLDALPHRTLAKWSGDDIAGVLDLAKGTFGVRKAAEWARDRLLDNRKLRKRDSTWHRALDLWEELEDDDGLLEVARRAVEHRDMARARLLLAERLLAREEHLQEADDALRPLYDVRGDVGARAHKLRQKLVSHPSWREARRQALEAFEERIGVGSGKRFPLRVIHTTPTWALVEAHEHAAPDSYEHKHLRTMVRARDLPAGVSPLHLRRGDVVEAPLRGEDADPKKDKEGLRVYWIADPSAIRLGKSPAEITARIDDEEARFGVGRGAPRHLKILRGKRDLQARLLDPGGGAEFYERAEVTAEQLPEGVSPEQLGRKGRSLWGIVERATDLEGKDGRRRYRVVGRLLPSDPNAEPEPVAEKKADKKPEPVAEKKTEPEADKKPEAVAEKKTEPEADTKPEAGTEKKAEPEPEADKKPEPVADTKPEAGTEKKPEPVADTEPEAGTDKKPEPVAETRPEADKKPEAVADKKPEAVAETTPEADENEAEADKKPEPRTEPRHGEGSEA